MPQNAIFFMAGTDYDKVVKDIRIDSQFVALMKTIAGKRWIIMRRFLEAMKVASGVFVTTVNDEKCVQAFLATVMRGDIDNAATLLGKNKQLAYASGNIVDLSGRTFSNITAFQYAVWSLDKPMCELLLEYLPTGDALYQWKALKDRAGIMWIRAEGFFCCCRSDGHSKGIAMLRHDIEVTEQLQAQAQSHLEQLEEWLTVSPAYLPASCQPLAGVSL